MRLLIVIAAFAAVAAPAAAQEKVCRAVEGGRLVCVDGMEAVMRRTDDHIRARGPVATTPQAGDEALAAQAQPFITARQQKLVSQVARAMLEGRCDKAETLAIRGGDRALATEAARRCVPKPKS